MLIQAIRQFCIENNLNLELSTCDTIPSKWQKLGDMILLPNRSFTSLKWKNLTSKQWQLLYEKIALTLKCKRLARQAVIDTSEKRKSQVQLLLGTDPWVITKDNGILYCLNITKTMYCAGNISEKIRQGKLAQKDEVIVDLYAGIGYFTLPYLIHAQVKQVIACEFHDYSIQGLKKALKLNNIDANRCIIYEGDNRNQELIPLIENKADRISLGLLPTSKPGYLTALKALKPIGGWLHIHENVKDSNEHIFQQELLQYLQQLSQTLSNPIKKKQWQFQIIHIERVKSYAPHIWHLVYDIRVYQQHQVNQINKSIPSIYKNTLKGYKKVSIIQKPDHDLHFWHNLFMSNKPCIIKGQYLGPASVGKWNDFNYLKKVKRNVSIHMLNKDEISLNYVGKKNYQFQTMSFNEFIDKLNDNHKMYLRSMGDNPAKHIANFHLNYPELTNDFISPIQLNNVFSSILRISAKNVQLWTHYDITSNLLCHCVGYKRVILFPPTSAADLQLDLQVNTSSSPIINIDDAKYSYIHKNAYECILSPGDILYIPALWFHNVTALSNAISINLFWKELALNYYQEKDIYGNKDIKLGVQILNKSNEIKNLLNQLKAITNKPQYYQFYKTRSLQYIE